MIAPLLLLACDRSAGPGPRPEPDTATDPTESGTADTVDSGAPSVCDPRGGPVRALDAAAVLEVVGTPWSLLGTSVACSGQPVGPFPTAVGVGGPQDANVDVLAYGVAAVLSGAQRGKVGVLDADLVIQGSDDDDGVGTRVVFPGDVDGDGAGDLLVTALSAYRPEALSGAAFLFAVEPGRWVPEDGTTHFLGGVHQSGLGGAARGGDLDGDGRAEVLLGHTNLGSPQGVGHIALHRGTAFPATVPPEAATVQFASVDEVQPAGWTMAVADIDGDGASDLVHGEFSFGGVFAPGRVTVLTGPLLEGPPRTLEDAEIVFLGDAEAPEASTGVHLAAGDVNGDGAVDLAISAHVSPGEAGVRAGRVFVFFGPVARGTHAVSDADLIIEGDTPYAWIGNGVTVLDHDGDGQQDLAVAAPEDPYFRTGCPGRVYVFPGPLPSGRLSPQRDAAVVYEDDLVGALVGDSLAACDLDGDGDDELVIGSRWATLDAAAPLAGRVQVVDGGPWP